MPAPQESIQLSPANVRLETVSSIPAEPVMETSVSIAVPVIVRFLSTTTSSSLISAITVTVSPAFAASIAFARLLYLTSPTCATSGLTASVVTVYLPSLSVS